MKKRLSIVKFALTFLIFGFISAGPVYADVIFVEFSEQDAVILFFFALLITELIELSVLSFFCLVFNNTFQRKLNVWLMLITQFIANIFTVSIVWGVNLLTSYKTLVNEYFFINRLNPDYLIMSELFAVFFEALVLYGMYKAVYKKDQKLVGMFLAIAISIFLNCASFFIGNFFIDFLGGILSWTG